MSCLFHYHTLAGFSPLLTFNKPADIVSPLTVASGGFNSQDGLLCEGKYIFLVLVSAFSSPICCANMCNLGQADKLLNVTDSAGLASSKICTVQIIMRCPGISWIKLTVLGGYFVFSFMLTAMIFISVYSKQTPVTGDWKLHQFLRRRGATVTSFLEGGFN